MTTMKTMHIPGFPEATDPVELPDIAELLVQPMVYKMDADEFRRRGTELQRWLLDRVPLTNRRRYVSVSVKVNLFYPGSAVESGEIRRERPWHRDGNMDLFKINPDVHHLLLTPCEVLTEFNTQPFQLQVPETFSVPQLMQVINNGRIKPQGRRMPANCLVTFGDHLHRPIDTRATHHQFRYSFRVVESDDTAPMAYPKCLQGAQHVLPHHTEDHAAYRINVERAREGGRIVLHLPDDPYRDFLVPLLQGASENDSPRGDH